MYFLHSRCYDRGNGVFCAISSPNKLGIKHHLGPQLVEASERANALLMTVCMIVKETARET